MHDKNRSGKKYQIQAWVEMVVPVSYSDYSPERDKEYSNYSGGEVGRRLHGVVLEQDLSDDEVRCEANGKIVGFADLEHKQHDDIQQDPKH